MLPRTRAVIVHVGFIIIFQLTIRQKRHLPSISLTQLPPHGREIGMDKEAVERKMSGKDARDTTGQACSSAFRLLEKQTVGHAEA